MSNGVLAYRYASALADVAEARDKLATVRDQLLDISQAMDGSREFDVAVATGLLSREQKKSVVREIAEQADLDPLVKKFLDYLVEQKRIRLVTAIADELSREADSRLGIAHAQVTSAAEMKPEQQEKLKQKLEQSTGNTVEIDWEVDENLLGGFQIRLDHAFYDASLRGRIDRLRRRLSHARESIHTT